MFVTLLLLLAFSPLRWKKAFVLLACQQQKSGKISHPGWKSAALVRESSQVL